MKNGEMTKEMVGGCCVCSDERGWQENPLVYCDGRDCTVAVHQACYGIVSVPAGPWFCEKCLSQEKSSKVKCELCPMREGAVKHADNGGWAHVVCALYIPEVRFGNVTTMDPIILSGVPPDRFSRTCYICEEKGHYDKTSEGACMQCNKSGCKVAFHVTCAQQEGLLCEESGQMDNIKYCGYCAHHFKKLKKDANIKTVPPYRPVKLINSNNNNNNNNNGTGNIGSKKFNASVISGILNHTTVSSTSSVSSAVVPSNVGSTTSVVSSINSLSSYTSPFPLNKEPPNRILSTKTSRSSPSTYNGGLSLPSSSTGTTISCISTTISSQIPTITTTTGSSGSTKPVVSVSPSPSTNSSSSTILSGSGPGPCPIMNPYHNFLPPGNVGGGSELGATPSSSSTLTPTDRILVSHNGPMTSSSISTNALTALNNTVNDIGGHYFSTNNNNNTGNTSSNTNNNAGNANSTNNSNNDILISANSRSNSIYANANFMPTTFVSTIVTTTNTPPVTLLANSNAQSMGSAHSVASAVMSTASICGVSGSGIISSTSRFAVVDSLPHHHVTQSASRPMISSGSSSADKLTSVATAPPIGENIAASQAAVSIATVLANNISHNNSSSNNNNASAIVVPKRRSNDLKTHSSSGSGPKKPRRSNNAKNIESLLNLVTPVVEDTVSSFQREKVQQASQRVAAAQAAQDLLNSTNNNARTALILDGASAYHALTGSAGPGGLGGGASGAAGGGVNHQSSSNVVAPPTIISAPCSINVNVLPSSGIPLYDKKITPPSPPVSETDASFPAAVSYANTIGPLRPTLRNVSDSQPSGSFPTSLEQLLERQWEQGSQFLMEQAQHFDIASLLSCLHQLKVENQRLEDHIVNLIARRDHLLAVNARLSLLLGSQQQHPSPHSPRVNASSAILQQASTSHEYPLESIVNANNALSRVAAAVVSNTTPSASKSFQSITNPAVCTVVSPPSVSSRAGSNVGAFNSVMAPSAYAAAILGGGGAGGVFNSLSKHKSAAIPQDISPDRLQQQQQQQQGSFVIPQLHTPQLAAAAEHIVRSHTPLMPPQFSLTQDSHHQQMLFQLMQQQAAYNAISGLIQPTTSPHPSLSQSHLMQAASSAQNK